jgi:hypothetical protein
MHCHRAKASANDKLKIHLVRLMHTEAIESPKSTRWLFQEGGSRTDLLLHCPPPGFTDLPLVSGPGFSGFLAFCGLTRTQPIVIKHWQNGLRFPIPQPATNRREQASMTVERWGAALHVKIGWLLF